MKRKILVIDDEKHMLSLLERTLTAEDTIVTGLTDGEEAIKFVDSNDVDLVITDISMPKMQGTDLFFALKKMNPFLEIIIITAYPSLENITKMLEGGASDFVIKPFDVDQIRAVVDESFSRIARWKSLRKEWLQYKKMRVEKDA